MPHRHDSQFREKDPVEIVVLQCWLGRITWLVDMTPKYHKNIIKLIMHLWFGLVMTMENVEQT